MRYVDFRDAIQRALRQYRRDGLTWAELRDRLELPYERPCPTWVKQLERDIGLKRVKGNGAALTWRV